MTTWVFFFSRRIENSGELVCLKGSQLFSCFLLDIKLTFHSIVLYESVQKGVLSVSFFVSLTPFS